MGALDCGGHSCWRRSEPRQGDLAVHRPKAPDWHPQIRFRGVQANGARAHAAAAHEEQLQHPLVRTGVLPGLPSRCSLLQRPEGAREQAEDLISSLPLRAAPDRRLPHKKRTLSRSIDRSIEDGGVVVVELHCITQLGRDEEFLARPREARTNLRVAKTSSNSTLTEKKNTRKKREKGTHKKRERKT